VRTYVSVLVVVLVAALAGAASGAGTPAADSGLIIFTAEWVTSLNADPEADPPEVTSVLCGVDLEGRTYRLSEPDIWSAPPSGPVWAPDGIHYGATYTGHVPGATSYGIGISGLDGTGRSGPEGILDAWSRDGTRLAYHRPNSGQIVVASSTGNGQDATPVGSGGGVSWSPDGAALAIAGAGGVHVVRLDGTSDRLLVADASDPAWSPDGTAIAVGTKSGLAVASATGGALHGLGIAGSQPAWAPSGARLAYIAQPRGIAVADADGSDAQILYRGPVEGRLDWQPVPHPELVARRAPCPIAPPPNVHTIHGSDVADNIWGTSGADTIDAGAGNDVVFAGAGNDVVRGGRGADELSGGAGNNVIDGGPGRDVIEGGSGSDVVHARDGERDYISCGAGRDTVVADPIDVVSADCEGVDGGDVLRSDGQAPATFADGPAVLQSYMNGRRSYRVTVYARDEGSGVARLWIERDGHVVVASRRGTCKLTSATRVLHGRVCGRTLSLSTKIDTRKLRAGDTTFRIYATDAAGNTSGHRGWTFFVDRSGPRARKLDTWFYDWRLHTAWIQIYSSDPGGSGTSRYEQRYRVNDGDWTHWIDPDAGHDTTTDVVEAHGVLPGDVVHAQIRETDTVGNVGPVVLLSTRVRGTEDNATNLPEEPQSDGPPIASVGGPLVRAGFASGTDSVSVTGVGESYAGTVFVSLEESGVGRVLGQASCSANCAYELSVGSTLNTSELPEGVVSIIARARDAAGKQGVSEKVELAIDKTPPAAPRITSCSWLPGRGLLALRWTAADPRLRDGVPGSMTATVRWRYRTGTTWSPWLIDGQGKGLMRTLYAPTRNATVQASAIDLVGNESALAVARCRG
jgi:hypothetical protein